MVQYRKPPQRSTNLIDRRTPGASSHDIALRRAAFLKKEMEEMLRRQAEAQLRRSRGVRSRRGR